MTQLLNPELIKNLLAHFVGRREPNYNIGQLYSTYALMHGARHLFWWGRNLSSNVIALGDYLSNIIYTDAGTPTRGVDGLLSYGVFDGANDYYWGSSANTYTQFYSDLAFVAWVRFGAGSLGNVSTVFSRWRTTTANRSYFVRKNASNVLQFSVSGDGTTEISVTSSLTLVADQWYFIAGRHTASTELAVWVSNPTTKKLVQDVNTTSIPADSFPTGAAEFNIGARNSGAGVHTDYLAGRLGLLWLGAYATPDVQIWNAYQLARPLLGL